MHIQGSLKGNPIPKIQNDFEKVRHQMETLFVTHLLKQCPELRKPCSFTQEDSLSHDIMASLWIEILAQSLVQKPMGIFDKALKKYQTQGC